MIFVLDTWANSHLNIYTFRFMISIRNEVTTCAATDKEVTATSAGSVIEGEERQVGREGEAVYTTCLYRTVDFNQFSPLRNNDYPNYLY